MKKKKKNLAEASLSTQEKLRPHETFDERDVRKFLDNISCRVTNCSPHLDGNREWAQ